jgi:hypothetical protein
MKRPIFAQSLALAVVALAIVATALALLGTAALAAKSSSLPRASTGGVAHVRGASAQLQGTVNPRGQETTYYFQYGPTIGYGAQTTPASAGKGVRSLAVGQTVANLPAGSHYRIVASNTAGVAYGHDRVYTVTKGRLKFVLESTKGVAPTPYGGTFVLRGTLSGAGGALQPIAAQTSAYPFLTEFVDVGTPLSTNAAGAFEIAIRGLTQSTQLRVRTNDARPDYSPIVTAHVSPRITLKVRTSSHGGLVRLYGTVTPAKVGAQVLFQLERPIRPRGQSEREAAFTTQGSTVVKRGTRKTARFSAIFTVRKGGRYRAYVVLPAGALVSGASPSVTLHAGPSAGKKTKR